MHEIEIVKELIQELESQAKNQKANKLTKVVIGISSNEHIIPESFQFWFDELSKGSIVEGTKLEFQTQEKEGVCIKSIELETDE